MGLIEDLVLHMNPSMNYTANDYWSCLNKLYALAPEELVTLLMIHTYESSCDVCILCDQCEEYVDDKTCRKLLHECFSSLKGPTQKSYSKIAVYNAFLLNATRFTLTKGSLPFIQADEFIEQCCEIEEIPKSYYALGSITERSIRQLCNTVWTDIDADLMIKILDNDSPFLERLDWKNR